MSLSKYIQVDHVARYFVRPKVFHLHCAIGNYTNHLCMNRCIRGDTSSYFMIFTPGVGNCNWVRGGKCSNTSSAVFP
jgi:hypothetical protein